MAEDAEVLVVGGGPTGLAVALAALQQGLSVRVVDKSDGRTPYSKALVVHARSMEVLEELGALPSVQRAGRAFRALHVEGPEGELGRIDFASLAWGDTPYPGWFTLSQSRTEQCLEEHLAAQGVVVERRTALRSVRQDARGVEATLEGPEGAASVVRARWLVGADGARSEVRRQVGVELEGREGSDVFVLGDVTLEGSFVDAEGYNILAREGVLLVVPREEPGQLRLIAHLPAARRDEALTLDRAFFQALLDARSGRRTRVTSVGWTSQFCPKHLLASRYRVGRVFLAGDAAHLHSPVGGQGLNAGLQDAYNLGWKLAAVHRGEAPDALLDSYDAERRALGASMLRDVQLATRGLTLRGPAAQRARNLAASVLLRSARVRAQFGAGVGMLGLRYPVNVGVASPASGLPRARAREGARTPWNASLQEALRGPLHALLLFCARGAPGALEAEALARRYAGDRARVVYAEDGALREAYGAQEDLAAWVRPDKVLAVRAPLRDLHALERWLRGVFLPSSGSATRAAPGG